MWEVTRKSKIAILVTSSATIHRRVCVFITHWGATAWIKWAVVHAQLQFNHCFDYYFLIIMSSCYSYLLSVGIRIPVYLLWFTLVVCVFLRSDVIPFWRKEKRQFCELLLNLSFIAWHIYISCSLVPAHNIRIAITKFNENIMKYDVLPNQKANFYMCPLEISQTDTHWENNQW